jgi:formamidopyrimidine-DNA glycosylase
MPELPEVETTAKMLNKLVKNLIIRDVWSDYNSKAFEGKRNIKDKNYFLKFREEIIGEKILKVHRLGKNVLFQLSNNKTILAHMKMTGHFLFGKYKFQSGKWIPDEKNKNRALLDPMNRFIHLVISLSNSKHLAFSDMRKFAKIYLIENKVAKKDEELKNIGTDALNTKLTLKDFKARLLTKKNAKIKTALMYQELISGIGNIYSDEILWASFVRPDRIVSSLNEQEFKKIFNHMKRILKKSISMGGDSMSDYRNPLGQRGLFQNIHKVYRRTRLQCFRKSCKGIIQKIVINSRSAHFCPNCQR